MSAKVGNYSSGGPKRPPKPKIARTPRAINQLAFLDCLQGIDYIGLFESNKFTDTIRMQVGALGAITYQLVNSDNEQIYLASRQIKGHNIFISDHQNKKIMTIRTESSGCPIGVCCCFANWCDFCAVRMSIQAYEGRRIGYLVQKLGDWLSKTFEVQDDNKNASFIVKYPSFFAFGEKKYAILDVRNSESQVGYIKRVDEESPMRYTLVLEKEIDTKAKAILIAALFYLHSNCGSKKEDNQSERGKSDVYARR